MAESCLRLGCCLDPRVALLFLPKIVLTNIQQMEKATEKKHRKNISLLVRKSFDGLLSDPKKYILNISDYPLSAEEFLIGNDLEFCIPPQNIERSFLLNLKFFTLN